VKRLSSFTVVLLAVSFFSILAWGAAKESSPAQKTSTPNSAHAFTSHETLQGTLTMVKIPEELIVVTNPSGVPFDFKIAHAKVEVNGSPARATALETEIGQQVSVRFLPFPSGDVAQNIVVSR
jgi:hypothetical protein